MHTGSFIRLTTLLAVSLFIAAFPLCLYADADRTQPRIILVLSGGGARGAAHIGVLKVIEELRIPVHSIVGTSMGAVVGGLYASGVPLEELERVAGEADWEGIFIDDMPRDRLTYRSRTDQPNYLSSIEIDPQKGVRLPKGLITGKRLDLLLRSFTLQTQPRFDDFPIPFRAVASDIETGGMVVLSHGDLAEALRASMAIPGVFEPVEIEGRLLVDGGVAQNLAVEVAKDMGADVVIAVDIGTPLSSRENLDNFLGVIDQITNILTNRNVAAGLKLLGPKDILIEPDLGPIATADFELMPQAVAKGEAAARAERGRLGALSLPEEEYRSLREQQQRRSVSAGKIEFVRLEQKSFPGSEFIIKLIGRSAGNVLHTDVLAYNLFELYRRGDFEDIDFTLVEEDGRQGLLVTTKKKERVRHTLSFGMDLSAVSQKDNNFRILGKYAASNLNRLGAEWKNEFSFGQGVRLYTEFYQPLNPYPWHIFIAPNAEYRSYPVDIYTDYRDDDALAEYRVHDWYGSFDTGLQMGEYGELRFGVLRGRMRSDLDIGMPQMPEESLDNGAYRIDLHYDRLDSASFPTRGGLLSVRYLYGREKLGSDDNYESIETFFVKALSYGRHSLVLRTRWNTNFGSTDSLSRGFFLGGFLNLSGLNMDQLYGNHLILGELVYCAKVIKLSKLFGRDLHVGFSLETGNTWINRSDINTQDLICAGSVFVGADSNIGPIFLGYGRAEGGNHALYFTLGISQF